MNSLIILYEVAGITIVTPKKIILTQTQRKILKNKKLPLLNLKIFFPVFILYYLWREKIKKNYFCAIKNTDMEKFKYIIIDDEHPSHLKIQCHFKKHTKYQQVATFYNPKKALQFLQENEVDLIFLDIEMPEMNGFQFLETLQKHVFVVILTAYQEKYSNVAHQYYDKNLVFFSNKAQFSYYLPKIIARFEKMYREKEVLNRVNLLSKNEIKTFPKKINNKTILLEEIIYIEVIGHNVVLKIKNNKELITRMALRDLLNILPVHIFFQIRRNTIINIGHVTAFTKSTVCIEGEHHIISEKKRKEVVSKLLAQKQTLFENAIH